MGNKEEELGVCVWLQSTGLTQVHWDSSKGWVQAPSEGQGGSKEEDQAMHAETDSGAYSFSLERTINQQELRMEGWCFCASLLKTSAKWMGRGSSSLLYATVEKSLVIAGPGTCVVVFNHLVRASMATGWWGWQYGRILGCAEDDFLTQAVCVWLGE